MKNQSLFKVVKIISLFIFFEITLFSCNDDDITYIERPNVEQIRKDPTHYFYIHFGTMPTLYSGLHVLSHNKPSYFAFERTGTFKADLFPSNVDVLFLNNDLNQYATRDILKNKIRQINKNDPNAIFGLYVDDLRAKISYDWFIAQGVDPSRIKVTLVSDGTATYNNFYNYFNSSSQGETVWKNIANEINSLNWNQNDNYIIPFALPEFESWTWPYYMSTLPNYQYLLQDSSLLETNNVYVQEQVNNTMNFLNLSPLEMLNKLSPNKQATFYKMAGFDKNKFINLFDESPKKNLIIIGTTYSSRQRTYLDKVYADYSQNYDIFYKPHPADLDYQDYETRYPGLKLLPAQMPFEIFVWALIDKIDIIGGNQSTVFLTVPTSKVRFIFASNADALPKPLNILFKDANVEWMQ